jgi:TatD DNase family protein
LKTIQLAKQYKLPIIHGRDAFDEIFAILRRKVICSGYFIAFQEIRSRALHISYNMKLGIGGVVTFKMVK